MLTELFQVIGILTFLGINWVLIDYLALRYKLQKNIYNIYRKMNIDQLLDEATAPISQTTSNQFQIQLPMSLLQRERLLSIVAGGNSKTYFGKLMTTGEIEKLDDKEVQKLYARYESYIGGMITRSLKETLCTAFTRAVEILCPVATGGHLKLENSKMLIENLSKDPIIDLALSTITCGLYHQYGYLLAPLEAGLLTSSHLALSPTESSITDVKSMSTESTSDAATVVISPNDNLTGN